MDSEKRTKRERATRESLKLMRRLLGGFRLHLDDALREKKVTAAQIRFLYELKMHPGATGAQLARACFITPQSAQAMMTRAIARGWITRHHSAENDRLMLAQLTPRGERLIRMAEDFHGLLEAKVWADIPTKDFEAINELLRRALTRL